MYEVERAARHFKLCLIHEDIQVPSTVAETQAMWWSSGAPGGICDFEEDALRKYYLDCTETSNLIVDSVYQKLHHAFQLQSNGTLFLQYFCRSNKIRPKK